MESPATFRPRTTSDPVAPQRLVVEHIAGGIHAREEGIRRGRRSEARAGSDRPGRGHRGGGDDVARAEGRAVLECAVRPQLRERRSHADVDVAGRVHREAAGDVVTGAAEQYGHAQGKAWREFRYE